EVHAVDLQGVRSSKEVRGLTLTADRELVHELQVPEDLAGLEISLKGKVKSLTTGAKIDVMDAAAFGLNQIDATDKVEDLHLGRAGAGYVLAELGKNGEKKKDRPINLTLKHRDFVLQVETVVQTDAEGRVDM